MLSQKPSTVIFRYKIGYLFRAIVAGEKAASKGPF